ncbi:TetR/AcrR family transcriptional regulator [Mammaliicoccus lentus]|uniref:TetR/AcrR family transcriptional regulator n=1 Tax=Mammaliicoccus lentus TaxID=42858 RepID=A0AAX3W5C1_MAMLE|nr:TetR/AcrR family transcriptional regulator [Mammaliicoccus lentus]WHI60377.1 TetR/AcrR family transcriptional regulator [Mammaliicoccus lentus]
MRKDAIENRLRIENTAKELFEIYGVENTSMNRISKELGIGMGTLYRHFEDKSALCYKLIENDFDRLFKEMDYAEQNNQITNYEKFGIYLELFIDFKSKHLDTLNCVEKKEFHGDFRDTPTFQKLSKKFWNTFDNEESPEWKTFKTDMLLNALSTKSYQYQVDKRGLNNKQLKQFLQNLFNMTEDF